MPVYEHQSTSAHVFEELYTKHLPSVFRVALTCVNRRDLAEDLTSETFLALYRNLDQIDASRLPRWLFTVVRNRARDHWRRRVVEQRCLETVAEPVSEDVPPFERWMLESPDLKTVHRTCLMMGYFYGMTRREIASKTGLSETQVKGHLQYALELLRKTYATPMDA